MSSHTDDGQHYDDHSGTVDNGQRRTPHPANLGQTPTPGVSRGADTRTEVIPEGVPNDATTMAR